MYFMCDVALWGYIPLVMWIFSSMADKRKAMLVSALIGVLFLPMYGYKVTGLPQYDKVTAVNIVVLLAAVLFDWGRVSLFRFKWFDLPILLFCLCPGISSLTNNLGLYDAISAILNHAPQWGPSYLLGRIYCNDLEGMKALAMTYFMGGLVYVPFCLYEIRMSPQFHYLVYGFHQHNIMQQMRYDGFRPMVFMQHGLAVGIWMSCASLTGIVLWRTKAVTTLFGLPMSWFVWTLVITTIMCKSTGSLVILAFGIAGFLLTQLGKRRIIIMLMILTPPIYMVGRITDTFERETMTTWVRTHLDDERAGSLDARLEQEDLFSRKAAERPIFGWGGWGRSWPTNEQGENITRGLDSLWVMFLGENGYFGLTVLTLSTLLPAILMLKRASAKLWVHPATAPAAAMSIVLIMYMIDNLSNAMLNPMLMLSAGAVSGWVMQTAPGAKQAPMPKRLSGDRGTGPTMPVGRGSRGLA